MASFVATNVKGQLASIKNEDGLVALRWFEREVQEDGSLSLPEEPEIPTPSFSNLMGSSSDEGRRLLRMSFKEVCGLNQRLYPSQPPAPSALRHTR
jgi:hypothetical protein